jgi:DNA-binding transcriptional ArsR family regulator
MAAAVQVIQSQASAETLLKPDRLRLLEMLSEPDSASGLARKLDMPRQTVNYHLRELENEGLVELVETRARRNCLERVVRATARSYVISPLVLGRLGLDPGAVRDEFSSAYLVSAAARAINDVTVLRQRANRAGKKLATLAMETEIRFASARSRQEFTTELLQTIAALAMKYHDEHAAGGRSFRLLVGAHPTITKSETDDPSSVNME